MSMLNQLKLSNTKKPSQMPATLHRRNKLSKRLWEQLQLAKAQANNTSFSVNKLKTVQGIDGIKRTIEMPKRIRPWWFHSDHNKLCLNVRYGARIIEISKGKATIEIENHNELIKTLELVKQAVEAGELDEQIELLSGDLRQGFSK